MDAQLLGGSQLIAICLSQRDGEERLLELPNRLGIMKAASEHL
jgi:hypothetical protein